MIDRFTVKDKDPNFVYRWCNTRERAMLEKVDIGWQVVRGASELPAELQNSLGQASESTAGGTTRTRGDLMLMRIPKDVHKERVEKPRREAAERQGVSYETMVAQANEQTRKQLRDKGYKGDQIRGNHVFLSSDRAGFEG